MTDKRTIILGGPRTGKTTLASALSSAIGVEPLHTDDLMRTLSWSEASQHIADDWLNRPGPWVIEGVACARALRKWLAAHSPPPAYLFVPGEGGKPCDEIILLTVAHVELTPGQRSMAKGCATVWAQIEPELLRRGVVVTRPAS